MAEWFEVYDARGVLVRARRRSNRLVLGYAAASGLLLSIAPVAMFALPRGGSVVAFTCGGVLLAHGAWLIRRLSRLHRTLWRLDLSVRRVLGFDTGRTSRALAWPDVHHVEVGREGLEIVGRTHGAWVRLRIPTTFPRFTALAHRAVAYAEVHGRPVWVDGQPWQALDLDALYGLDEVGAATSEPRATA